MINKKQLKKIFSYIFVIVIFGFMFKVLFDNAAQLRDYDWVGINYFYVAISFLFLLLAFVGVVFAFQTLLGSFGVRIKLMKVASIISLANLGRFVPGKVWAVLGMVHFGRKHGISGYVSSTCLFVSIILTSIAAFFVFVVSLPFWPTLPGNFHYIYIVLLAVALIVFIQPPIFNRIVSYMFKKLKKKDFVSELTYKTIIMLFGVYVLVWMFNGTAFYLLVSAISPQPLAHILPIIGIYTISWVIGLYSFLTPGGLGVREGIISALLATYVTYPVAIVIAIISRIWILLFQGAVAAYFLKEHRN